MKAILTVLGAAVCAASALIAAPEWTVTVDPNVELGPIRRMNAVNNGPTKPRSDQTKGNFDEYAALKIPYARIHDASHCSTYGGPHCVDISAVFPNFDADESDPRNYDFTLTDEYLSTMRAAGTEPYYRLGQSIEHWIKKYGVNPPKDFAKWARICEHVVRHYNEGWADGFRWNLKYWEIWCEPDGNKPTKDGRPGPTWTGTNEQFLELYKVTSRHLRACFGDTIKIGGPGFCWWGAWKDQFLPYCAANGLPLDFYSWHCYFRDVAKVAEDACNARKLLDDNGFTKTESHMNEWNYVRSWSDGWVYSLECEMGRLSEKGAAAEAAVMIACQNAPVDMIMFYDARVIGGMNNLFDTHTLRPMRGYHPFLAWRRLADLGTQVKATVDAKDLKAPQFYACAARNKAGKLALLVARFTDDNNVVETRRVNIVAPRDCTSARCHLTDAVRFYTETPLVPGPNGTGFVKMEPNSFAFIEFD